MGSSIIPTIGSSSNFVSNGTAAAELAALFNYEYYATDIIEFDSTTQWSSGQFVTLNHSLGKIPRIAILCMDSTDVYSSQNWDYPTVKGIVMSNFSLTNLVTGNILTYSINASANQIYSLTSHSESIFDSSLIMLYQTSTTLDFLSSDYCTYTLITIGDGDFIGGGVVEAV